MSGSNRKGSPLSIFHFKFFGLVLFSLVSGCSYKCWIRPGGGKVPATAAKLSADLHFPTSHSYSQPLPAKTKTKTNRNTKTKFLLLQQNSVHASTFLLASQRGQFRNISLKTKTKTKKIKVERKTKTETKLPLISVGPFFPSSHKLEDDCKSK